MKFRDINTQHTGRQSTQHITERARWARESDTTNLPSVRARAGYCCLGIKFYDDISAYTCERTQTVQFRTLSIPPYHQQWPAKYTLFFVLLIICMLMPVYLFFFFASCFLLLASFCLLFVVCCFRLSCFFFCVCAITCYLFIYLLLVVAAVALCFTLIVAHTWFCETARECIQRKIERSHAWAVCLLSHLMVGTMIDHRPPFSTNSLGFLLTRIHAQRLQNKQYRNRTAQKTKKPRNQKKK